MVLYLFCWFLLFCGSVLTVRAQIGPGTVDQSFDPIPPLGWVEWLDIQPDGSVIVLTNSTVGPSAKNLPLLRFLENGQRDSNFKSPVLPYAASFLLDRSNRVIYAERPSLAPLRKIGRLLENGSSDAGFNAEAGVTGGGTVETILELPDGSILMGGIFTQVNGEPRQSIARLTESGDLAPDFSLNFNMGNPSVWIYSLARQSDGKILVAGTFTNINGLPRGGIARLNPDGVLDESFVPAGAGPSSAAAVYAVAIHSDGKILAGGPFSRWGNDPIGQLVQLNTDGSVDRTFTTTNRLLVVSGSTPSVERILVQEDGKIVIGGRFSFAHGQPRSALARLLPNGELDSEFNVEIRNQGQVIKYLPVMDLAPGDKLMFGGTFTEVNGVARTNIARVFLSEPALEIGIESLTVTESNNLIIQFNASTAGEFAVESSSDLKAWQAIGPALQVSAAGTTEVTVPQPPGNAQFFRVRSAGMSEWWGTIAVQIDQ